MNPRGRSTVTSSKNRASKRLQLVGFEQRHVERVLEVGRSVGRDDERGAARGRDARELGGVLLRRAEVLDDVRRAHPVDRTGPGGDAGAVHGREAHPARFPLVGGVDRGLRVVVDTDHQASEPREPRGLVAHAASHVEHGPGADAIGHLPVSGVVEREEGVGGGARHGALAGEPSHRVRLCSGRGPFPDRGRRPHLACTAHDRSRPHDPGRTDPGPCDRGRQARRHRRRGRPAPGEHARVARPRRSRGRRFGAARLEHRQAVGRSGHRGEHPDVVRGRAPAGVVARRLPRDPQGRSVPRVPACRVQRDDGLARWPRRSGRDLERHAVLLTAVVAHRARHVAAPRARGDVADDAAAAARRVRQLRRVEGGATHLPPHVDGHVVRVEQARDGARPRIPGRSGERGRAGHRPALRARWLEVADAAGRGGRALGAGEAVRRARRRARRAQGRPSGARGGHRRRGLQPRRPRGADPRRPCGVVDQPAGQGRRGHQGRPLPASVGALERVGARGVGDDDHRGGRVRHARGGERRRRPRRRGRRRRHRHPLSRGRRPARRSRPDPARPRSAHPHESSRRARTRRASPGKRPHGARSKCSRRRPSHVGAGKAADEVHRHRPQLPAHRDERSHHPRRPVALRVVLLALVVALPDGRGSRARGARARLRVPHAPPLRSLPLPVDASDRPIGARARAEVRRPDPRRGGPQPRIRRGHGAARTHRSCSSRRECGWPRTSTDPTTRCSSWPTATTSSWTSTTASRVGARCSEILDDFGHPDVRVQELLVRAVVPAALHRRRSGRSRARHPRQLHRQLGARGRRAPAALRRAVRQHGGVPPSRERRRRTSN